MLSKKTQYAFQALMYLAEKGKDQPVLIADIAKRKRIPLKFLENILLELKKAGLLNSKKGKGGGYFFAKNPKDIQLATVMRLLDGPISLVSCVSLYFYEKCKNCDEKELWFTRYHGTSTGCQPEDIGEADHCRHRPEIERTHKGQ